MLNAVTATVLGIALSAAFIYVLLRFIVKDANQGNRANNISRHAFWTAVIALFASGVTGLSNLWAIPNPHLYNESSLETRIMHAAAPGLWLGVIYVLGQFTWPRHLQPVRSASLEVRSAKKLVPKYLSGVLLLCTLLSAAAITLAWSDPGAPGRVGSDDPQSQDVGNGFDEFGQPLDDEGNAVDSGLLDENGDSLGDNRPYVAGITGTLPGKQVGPFLAGGLGLVLFSVVGVVTLVVRRPPLQTLDTEENDTLRKIWINRLLRTAVIVVAGFGAMSLQYISQGVGARDMWAVPMAPDGSFTYPDNESTANWLMGASTIFMLAVVVAMAAWTPPRLPVFLSDTPRTEPPSSPGFRKARDFLLLVQGISLAALFAASFFPGLQASPAGTTTWQTTTVDGEPVEDLVHVAGPTRLDEIESLALTVALLVGSYLLLQLLANHIVQRRLGDSVELDVPRQNLLPTWFTVLIGVAVATGIASIASFALGAPTDLSMAVAWMLAILGGTAVLAVLLYRAAARRPAIDGASDHEDFQIRVLIAHRGARALGGVSLIVAGILSSPSLWVPAPYADYLASGDSTDPSGLQVFFIALGLGLCFLPAATAFPMRGNRPLPSISANA